MTNIFTQWSLVFGDFPAQPVEEEDWSKEWEEDDWSYDPDYVAYVVIDDRDHAFIEADIKEESEAYVIMDEWIDKGCTVVHKLVNPDKVDQEGTPDMPWWKVVFPYINLDQFSSEGTGPLSGATSSDEASSTS